jgi:hypothetical protein
LSDEDRERLGAPEWIEYDPQNLSANDAATIEVAGGNWRAWPGQSITSLRLAVLLALRKAGKDVTFDDVDFNILGGRFEAASPGKAPSAKGSARTRSTSAGTSRTSTSRRKA